MSAIVLFDGVCNFCNGTVNFIIDRDRADQFKFAPLQSDIGQELLKKHHIDSEQIDSVILIENDKAYMHSTAALRIAKRLPVPWAALYSFVVVPRPARDFFYKLFAKNRYRLFGRQDACKMPTPEIREKFLG